MSIQLYRVIETSDGHNLGLTLALDINNLPAEFYHRDFYFDSLKWEVFDNGLRVSNPNYIAILSPVGE